MQDSPPLPASAPPVPVTAEQPPATSNRSALLIVFLVVFVDLLGFGIVLPMLPRIADAYVGQIMPAGASKETFAGLVIGLLMSSFSLMQFIFAPVWRRVSTRFD